MKRILLFWKLLFCLYLFDVIFGQKRIDEKDLKIKIIRIGNDVYFKCFLENENRHTKILIAFWIGPTGGVYRLSSEMTLRDVDEGNAGKYTCKATGFINDKLFTGSAEKSLTKEQLKPIKMSSIRTFQIEVSKDTIFVTEYERFEFECFSKDKKGKPAGSPFLQLKNGLNVSDDKRFLISNVEPSRILAVAPNGVGLGFRKLQIYCISDDLIKEVNINVINVCPRHKRFCNSGECIHRKKFCNGKKDCIDGSDENRKYCRPCNPIRKPCAATNTIDKTTSFFNIQNECNGIKDCKNGFDERNCPVSRKCNTVQFTCHTGEKIPYSYVCDGKIDCNSKEDEHRCSNISLALSYRKIEYGYKGSTVELFCVGISVPWPKIIWTFNGWCLPDNKRMLMTESRTVCNRTVGVLTIKNFKPIDEAIYSCELYNGFERRTGSVIDLRFTK